MLCAGRYLVHKQFNGSNIKSFDDWDTMLNFYCQPK
jgi:hypothetical protein